MLGAGDVAGVPLLALAHVDQRRSPLPFEVLGLTSEGSTSSIWLLIWRMTSAPDGLMRDVLEKSVGIQYFRSDSGADGVIDPITSGAPRLPMRPRQMRTRTLLTQVLAVNTVLVAVTAFVAAVVARDRLEDATSTAGRCC